MEAAGILGDVAADRTCDLRRGIGSVVEPVDRNRFRNGKIAHARLQHGDTRERIDGQDALELGERQHHAVGVGCRAPGQTRARATRHDRQSRCVADFQNLDDLRLVFKQKHRQRLCPEKRQAIAFIGARVLLGGKQRGRRKNFAERGEQGFVEHGED